MQWELTPAAMILFLTSALSLIVSWLTLVHRRFPGGRTLPLIMLSVAAWSLCSGIEAASLPLATKILWSKLEYIGLAATPPLFLLFAARYAGVGAWFRGTRGILLWIPAPMTLALALTNDVHGWLWSEFLAGSAGSHTLIYVHGPAYYAIAAQVYAFIGAGCVLLGRTAFRSVERRRQAATILFASLFPFVGGVLYVLDPSIAGGLDLIPISFFLSGLVFLLGIGFFRVFNIVPVARSALVEQMADAVIVTDVAGRIVDANPTAERWLAMGPLAGRALSEALSAWPELRFSTQPEGHLSTEITLRREPLLHVDMQALSLRGSSGRPGGSLIVMRDITERFRAGVELEQANVRLADQVKRIEALQTELREESIRDSLTGLFNRRYLDEVLPRELSRASHERGVVSVVMIDIDHFKETNDQRGHREGDRLLSLLGMLLRERSRPSDVACRYGGEEFLLILPGAMPDAAHMRMEEIRAEYIVRLRAAGFAHPPTLSAGVAAFPEHAQSDDELLQAADAALYAAKAAGRNRVCVAGSRLELGES